jgi:hypothetical protein
MEHNERWAVLDYCSNFAYSFVVYLTSSSVPLITQGPTLHSDDFNGFERTRYLPRTEENHEF